MVEWTRRLRMSLASSSPGASGDTARPNYVGPSGNGLVERMKAGESPSNQGRTVWAPLSVSRRRSRCLRKTPQWSAARRAGPRHGPASPFRWRDRLCRKASHGVRRSAPAPFGAPLPHVVRERPPLVSEGREMPGAPRALREQGRRSFGFFACWLAGCLKCESDTRARRAFSSPPTKSVAYGSSSVSQ
jgi:hypothetical protein